MCVVLAPRERTSRQLSLLGLASENVEVTACVSPSVSLWQPWRVAWQAGGMALAVGICPAHPRTAVEPQTPVLGEGVEIWAICREEVCRIRVLGQEKVLHSGGEAGSPLFFLFLLCPFPRKR